MRNRIRLVFGGLAAILLTSCATLDRQELQADTQEPPPARTIPTAAPAPSLQVAEQAAALPLPSGFESGVSATGPVALATGRPPESSTLIYDNDGHLMFQGHGVPSQVIDGPAL